MGRYCRFPQSFADPSEHSPATAGDAARCVCAVGDVTACAPLINHENSNGAAVDP